MPTRCLHLNSPIHTAFPTPSTTMRHWMRSSHVPSSNSIHPAVSHCRILSPDNWMVAYLGYTLRMRTLFRGWLIMVNDTHTRRRRPHNTSAIPCDWSTNNDTSHIMHCHTGQLKQEVGKGGKRIHIVSLYWAPYPLSTQVWITVLHANYTIPACTSKVFTRWHHHWL